MINDGSTDRTVRTVLPMCMLLPITGHNSFFRQLETTVAGSLAQTVLYFTDKEWDKIG